MRFNSDYFVLIRRAQHPSRIDLAEPVDVTCPVSSDHG
jgi:hypothetical protein